MCMVPCAVSSWSLWRTSCGTSAHCQMMTEMTRCATDTQRCLCLCRLHAACVMRSNSFKDRPTDSSALFKQQLGRRSSYFLLLAADGGSEPAGQPAQGADQLC